MQPRSRLVQYPSPLPAPIPQLHGNIIRYSKPPLLHAHRLGLPFPATTSLQPPARARVAGAGREWDDLASFTLPLAHAPSRGAQPAGGFERGPRTPPPPPPRHPSRGRPAKGSGGGRPRRRRPWLRRPRSLPLIGPNSSRARSVTTARSLSALSPCPCRVRGRCPSPICPCIYREAAPPPHSASLLPSATHHSPLALRLHPPLLSTALWHGTRAHSASMSLPCPCPPSLSYRVPVKPFAALWQDDSMNPGI